MKYDPNWTDEEKAEYIRWKYRDMALTLRSLQPFDEQDLDPAAGDESHEGSEVGEDE